MVHLSLRDLAQQYDTSNGGRRIFAGLDLDVEPGQIVALRGDNGTGKTTLLKVIVGVDRAMEGAVAYTTTDGVPVRIGFVQQDYTSSLLPWLNVLDNVSVPLRLRGEKVSACREAAAALLEELGFGNLPYSARPHQLSGGQKQRLAVARALIVEPHLLVLDEPFTSLDTHTSRDLQETISALHQRRGTTILFVSHDLDHCVYLADRVIFLYGSPARILHDFSIDLPRPRRRSVMLGSPYQSARLEIITAEEATYGAR